MEPNEYIHDLNDQLSYLIAFAQATNELDMAGALFQESRGMQDAGWTTTITAYEIFDEMRALGSKEEPLTTAEYRQFLCLYAQLAEAGGVYEVLSNLMGVIQLKPYNLWPFQDLVSVRENPKRIIGPNANAMFRKLAQTAESIGMTKLASLLEITFRDDIRNGVFHADYIIWNDGLRLRRRNGGNPYSVPHEEVTKAISIGVMFFDIFNQLQQEARQSFRPAKEIIGRFSLNPPMRHTVELQEDGSFSISSSSPGSETDAAYDRQQLVNNRLGGRVYSAYTTHDDDDISSLLEEIKGFGFDVSLVVLGADEQLAEVEAEVETHGLWASNLVEDRTGSGLLIASPFGFIRVSSLASFRASLPKIEKLEVV